MTYSHPHTKDPASRLVGDQNQGEQKILVILLILCIKMQTELIRMNFKTLHVKPDDN